MGYYESMKEIESYWSFVISKLGTDNIASALKTLGECAAVSGCWLHFQDDNDFTWRVEFTRTNVSACRLLFNEHYMLDTATIDGALLPIEQFKQLYELERFTEALA